MTINLAVSRLLYINLLLMLALLDSIVAEFVGAVERNAFSLLAAATGALVIRFAWPSMPVRQSISGWLTGFLLACLFGNSAHKGHLFHLEEVYATWGVVALIGDILVQLVGWVIRLARPIGDYAVQHPGEALDEGLGRIEKITTIWVRIKTPLLDLVDTLSSRFSRKS